MSVLALTIDKLLIQYPTAEGPVTAVDNVSFQIQAGEFFGLLGPNGAGKTSIISSIVGLVNAQAGKIEVFGQPAGRRNSKRLIGYVPQELVGHGFFNLNEVLNFISGYFGIRNNQKRIDELLERLQLTSCKYKLVSQLSGGMKRRMLIAKALVHSPSLLLLDEPPAGVDVELRGVLWAFAEELNRQGTTILLTTHYLEEAQRLCQRVAIMDKGKVLALDQTGRLVSALSERNIRLTLKSDRVLANGVPSEKPERGLLSVRQMDRALEVRVSGNLDFAEILSLLQLPAEEIVDIRTEEGKLEQAFLKLIRRGTP